MKRKRKQAQVSEKTLKLDFGCGPNKREGFEGVDIRPFPGVDHMVDLAVTPWPWNDVSVDEAIASHFIEHLTAPQRISFCNELYRILKPGATCQITVPHWCSYRAYGDLTHQWPPVSEMWFYYLNKDWRAKEAPHNDAYTCDFDATWGYAIRPDLVNRNNDFQQFALVNYKDAAADIIATLKKK